MSLFGRHGLRLFDEVCLRPPVLNDNNDDTLGPSEAVTLAVVLRAADKDPAAQSGNVVIDAGEQS